MNIISVYFIITKTCLFRFTETFITKNENFQIKKKSYTFHISAQNTDCGYALEPPMKIIRFFI